jgi:hypothetical protein
LLAASEELVSLPAAEEYDGVDGSEEHKDDEQEHNGCAKSMDAKNVVKANTCEISGFTGCRRSLT